MEPVEFARKYLGEWKQKGDEIVPKLCPFCQGGSHHDKDSFALNVSNLTYNCKRGTCGKKGHFSQLCKEYGEKPESDWRNFEMKKPPKKIYKMPETKIDPAKKRVEDYLILRGLSKETWERRGVGETNGNIALPYIEDGKVVLVKFRKPEKYDGNGQKAWREAGGKAVLWGMDLCDTEKPLVIVEGEMDALALDEAGVKNVVSVPSGASDLTWIENCWDWLDKFKKIIIWGDNDDPGREMVRNIIVRLGEWKCSIVDSPWKDANVCLIKEGKEKTAEYAKNAKPIPIYGLIDLADVVPIDVKNIERTRSNVPGIDEAIGGFLMGELSVWTGKSGQGKSTFLSQMLLETVNEGKPVCAYSGELRADRFQYWINLQAAGKNNLSFHMDNVKQKQVAYLEKDINSKIREWYRGKFWLYDNNINSESAEETGIIKLFTYAASKYGCRVFLVDNLMTAKYTQVSEDDFFRAQSSFVGELVRFAKTYNVHVHLVAHPRKTRGRIEKEDISGTGDITNRADNVFAVERAEEDTALGCDSVVTILKNRSEGVQNYEIGLMFDPDSKRFWQPTDTTGANKKYGWEEPLSWWGNEVIDVGCPF